MAAGAVSQRGDDADVIRLDVLDAAEAHELCFLGSPSIRIDGRDAEPGSAQRTDYSYGYRVYRTSHGQSGLPSKEWIRALLADSSQRHEPE